MVNLQDALSFVKQPSTTPILSTKSATSQASSVNDIRLKRSGFLNRRLWWFFGLVFIALATFVSYFNVDRALTDEDRYYIKLYLPNVPEDIARSSSYESQIKLIQRAQKVIYLRTIGWIGIPEGMAREPKQLYLSRSGMCYDRSRVLEKIFTYMGFTIRHLAMFERQSYQHAYSTILFQHIPSHAISEVLTKKGWLMVDSNDLWISLDSNQKPVSMPQMQARYRNGEKIQWEASVLSHDEAFYNKRCIALYGLYSRHGCFYPPYVKGIPDFRVRDLFYNFEQFGISN